jgi:hypothetical protein
MLIRQASVEAFLGWANDEAYIYGLGHRTAAIEDSRLLPLVQRTASRAADRPYLKLSA